MAQLKAKLSLPNTGGWKDRHDLAVLSAGMVRGAKPFETAVAQMAVGWGRYAIDHRSEYETPIGDDGVLGPEWLAVGKGLIGLLNGQTGRLDCGTVDAFIRDTVHENGFPDEFQ